MTKIVAATTIVTSPGRNFVTVRISTSDGLVGYGDATLNGRELAVVSYLDDYLLPQLIGRDAHRIEDTWQLFYRGGYWRRGPVTMAAIAGIDVALWDLKAQAAQMPLYQLLGGASRTALATYGHATGRDFAELADSIRAHQEKGFRHIRVQSAPPGLGRIYGVHDGTPTQSGLPVVEQWDTPAYLRHAPRMFEAVRSEFGEELSLLHDTHHRLTPIQAAQLGKNLEPYSLFWLEDVTPAENQEGFRAIRQHTTTPLAVGEVLNSAFDYLTLISEQLIDFVRSSVTHAGGITGLRRILDFAALYQIRSGMHGPADISPIGMAAAGHLALAIHNFGVQEYIAQSASVHDVFPSTHEFRNGNIHVSDHVGLGAWIDETAAAGFPYERSFLPINQLADASVHDW